MPKREPAAKLVVAIATTCALALPLGIGKAALGIASGTGTMPLASAPSSPAPASLASAAVRNRAVSAGSRTSERQTGQDSAEAVQKKAKSNDRIPRPAGTQRSCSMTHRFPDAAPSTSIVNTVRKTWGVRLQGPSWRKKANRPALKVMWQTLDAIDCTPFLKTVSAKNDGILIISGEKVGSWAWGDYGYSDPDGVSFSLDKMAAGIDDGQSPRVVRVMVHEMAHAWSADRNESSGYFAAFAKIEGAAGAITKYGSQNTSENFAEAAGYYVARCAKEQSDIGRPSANPYDDAGSADYFKFVGKKLFAGVTFGPRPGGSC